METTLDPFLPLLSQTPATLSALLLALPAAQLDRNEGGDTWNARETVAHLIHTDRINWIPRIRHTLDFGESAPFPSFDRLGHRCIDLSRSMDDLLQEFTATRRQSLDALHTLNLEHADFARRGAHPVLGAVTVSNLLAAWTTHDLTHLHQLIRLLADPFRASVGPFIPLLGVLQCRGHGEPAGRPASPA